jgi:hypothetical protein
MYILPPESMKNSSEYIEQNNWLLPYRCSRQLVRVYFHGNKSWRWRRTSLSRMLSQSEFQQYPISKRRANIFHLKVFWHITLGDKLNCMVMDIFLDNFFGTHTFLGEPKFCRLYILPSKLLTTTRIDFFQKTLINLFIFITFDSNPPIFDSILTFWYNLLIIEDLFESRT